MNTIYNQKQLKSRIIQQQIQNTTLFYTLVKKDQKNLSFLTNERLLIYNEENQFIYYIKIWKNLPFRNSIPQPIKEYTTPQKCKISIVGDNMIEILFSWANQKQEWRFAFETSELTFQWINLLTKPRERVVEKTKKPQQVLEQVNEFGEKEEDRDILKVHEKSIIKEESKILESGIRKDNSKANLENLIVKDNSRLNESLKQSKIIVEKAQTEWNYRFFKDRSLRTIYEFQIAATKSFMSSYQKDQQLRGGNQLRQFENEDLKITITDRNTAKAKILKEQFNNYHFIMDATKEKFIVGVPLSCFFRFENVIGLVKAKVPQNAKVVAGNTIFLQEDFKNLQRYTRIKNIILTKCNVYEVSESYQESQPIFFIDNLFDYLPENTEFSNQRCQLRPEFVLDQVDYLLNGGFHEKKNLVEKNLRITSEQVINEAVKLGKLLSKNTFEVARTKQLISIFHEKGINLKYISVVYNECQNASIKKYIYTMMAVRITKEYLLENFCELKLESTNADFVEIFEDSLMMLIEGKNNRSHTIWKEISLLFKKKFNIILNNSEIEPGFYFNSLLQCFPGNYDMEKLNKNKQIFKDQGVVDRGFVRQLFPKTSLYQRFVPSNFQNLKFKAKETVKDDKIYTQICQILEVDKYKEYDQVYTIADNDEWMLLYLSFFMPPPNIARKEDKTYKPIYARVNEESPSRFTLKITLHYLDWCIKYDQQQQFMAVYRRAEEIVRFWLDDYHPFKSDLTERLSDLHGAFGNPVEMLRYMKESIQTCARFMGKQSSECAQKLYKFGQKHLKIGKTQQSQQNFNKCLSLITLNKLNSNMQGLSLLHLSQIYLYNLQYESSKKAAVKAIEVLEDFQKKNNAVGIYNEQNKMKCYQLLGRIYEICNYKLEYKEMANECCRRFNYSSNPLLYKKMVKICLSAGIYKGKRERCDYFIKLILSLHEKAERDANQADALKQLMRMSHMFMVMDKFLFKYQHFERSLIDSTIRSKVLSPENSQFLEIVGLILNSLGKEYIIAICDERLTFDE